MHSKARTNARGIRFAHNTHDTIIPHTQTHTISSRPSSQSGTRWHRGGGRRSQHTHTHNTNNIINNTTTHIAEKCGGGRAVGITATHARTISISSSSSTHTHTHAHTHLTQTHTHCGGTCGGVAAVAWLAPLGAVVVW
jgi:hypothetical protein